MGFILSAAHHLKSKIKKNERSLRNFFAYRHLPECMKDLFAGRDDRQIKPIIDRFKFLGVLLGHLLYNACHTAGITVFEFLPV